MRISHVSRHFRDVALVTSSLWKTIHFSLPFAMLPILIARGRGAGLDIDLTGWHILSGSTPKFIEQLLMHTADWTRFRMGSFASGLLSAKLRSINGPLDFARLQSVHLEGQLKEAHFVFLKALQAAADACATRSEVLEPPLPMALRSCNIDWDYKFDHAASEPYPVEMLTCVASFNALTSLCLHLGFFAGSFPIAPNEDRSASPWHFTRLQHLVLHLTFYDEFPPLATPSVALLERLRVPALEVLQIDVALEKPHTASVNEFKASLHTWADSLQKLLEFKLEFSPISQRLPRLVLPPRDLAVLRYMP